MSGRPTAAREYGFVLGPLQHAAEGFRIGYAPSSRLTADQVERRRELTHRRRVAAERAAGLAFVQAEAERVARELGLRGEV